MSRFEVDPRKVVHETIDGEAILIQLQSGAYYSLDAVGSEIWDLLVGGCSESEIVSLLELRYEDGHEAVAEVVTVLLRELQQEELVEPAAEPFSVADRPPPALPATGKPDAFVAPVLRKYTDMQDFLLVDPIHEVEESGWPDRRIA